MLLLQYQAVSWGGGGGGVCIFLFTSTLTSAFTAIPGVGGGGGGSVLFLPPSTLTSAFAAIPGCLWRKRDRWRGLYCSVHQYSVKRFYCKTVCVCSSRGLTCVEGRGQAVQWHSLTLSLLCCHSENSQ